MRSTAKVYDQLRADLTAMPLVDCHDHADAIGPCYTDPIQAAIGTFYVPDEVGFLLTDDERRQLFDFSRPYVERWPLLEKSWRQMRHTGYAQLARLIMKRFYCEEDLTLEALHRISGNMLSVATPEAFEKILDEAGIVVRLANVVSDLPSQVRAVAAGSLKLPPRSRLVVPITNFHTVAVLSQCQPVTNAPDLQAVAAAFGRTVLTLDDYLVFCRELFTAYRRLGAVAFKDVSAYTRPLAFTNPTRAEAEAVFNWFMADPRRKVAFPDQLRPLDDFLFHQFMAMARDLALPVQIHTGHLAGSRNNLTNANAIQLVSVLELHRDVQFDLFHANWPYGGEILFLGKNYPNVRLDFCWSHIIDPVGTVRLLEQTVSAVPHAKIHAYGSDMGNSVEQAWAHAEIARDNVATALANLVELDYFGLDDAREVARCWLFDNANKFFRLGA